MPVDEKLDRLSQQLSKHSLGPVDTVINETMSRLAAASSAVAAWLRQAADEQPLITLLLAAQSGYLLARLGRRYARH
jgi:hypothetical protein